MIHKTYKCRLCEQLFSESEMSEEHYPAKCVGNNDIIALDFIKMMDSLQSGDVFSEVTKGLESGKGPKDAAEKYFDDKLAKPLYPNGRTARTLCRKCNTFLGKYDEAYQKFFDADGQSRIINGFQAQTKIQIIKALYAKFLSVPEAQAEKFDFLNFVRDTSCVEYTGKWHLYFVKRDFSSDLMGLKDIGTGKLDFDEGVVYVDNVALDEPYVNALVHEREDFTEPVTVPEGCVFVMGDNRNRSTDSRYASIGCVDERLLIGKAYFRLFPFSKIGGLY